MNDKVIEKLKERLKNSASEALKRHAQYDQPIVYKRSGKVVLEWVDGKTQFVNVKSQLMNVESYLLNIKKGK